MMADEGDESCLHCTVENVYQLGKEEMALLNFGDTQVRAYLSFDYGLKAGDEVTLQVRDRGVFLFDLETGRRYA